MNNLLNKHRTLPTILLFVVAAIWGSGFIASQAALDAGVTPELLMFVRFTIAALIVLATSLGRLRRNMVRQNLRGGLTVGAFLFIAFYVQIVALQYTTPSNNAFITAANVVMVPFVWWGMSGKRPEARIFASSVLCLIGIGVLSVKLSEGISFSAGDLLTLVCAFFFACQIAATGRYAERMDTTVLVFLQFATASILSLGVFLLVDRDLSPLMTAGGFWSLVYLGVLSTCVCYFLQTVAQRYVSSAKAAIILATESLFGTLFSVMVGYDKLTTAMLVGGSIIIVSLVLTELQPANKTTAKQGE